MGLSGVSSATAVAEALDIPMLMLSELDKPTRAALTEEYEGFKPGTRKIAIALGALGATVVCMAVAIAGAVGLNYAIFGTTGFENGFSAPDAGVGEGEGE